ncbi:recombinase family protein [Streptomyces coeruleoprunus]|uniref:Recombinase family protein n=1 Tax=Streptomyces coeruleoprunus TaxID=285563 RepID=A0ABV9XGL9_9ACTN
MGALRAVDYLRVSTEEQAEEGYGISYTGKNTARHIKKKGWAHVGTYIDEGLSGSLEAHDRPDLKRLMADAYTTPRPFDMVVVPEGRVIGRVGRAFWRWVWELEDIGVYVAVVKKDYDNSTPSGRSQMRKDADYAEEERENIRERTQGGIQDKAEDGLYPGGRVPFGWEIADLGKRGKSRYVVSEVAAKTKRRAYELFLEHRSWTDAALLLNGEKLFSQEGLPWTAPNLRKQMLSDATLNNRVVWRGRQAAKKSDGSPVYGEPVTINLPPIFSEEETRTLQAAAGQPSREGGNTRPYPLTGRLVSPCGNTYRSQTYPGSRVYRCNGKWESHPGAKDQCSCPPLDAEPLEKRVWDDVRELLTDTDRMKALAREWIGAAEESQVDHEARIATLSNQIAKQRQTMNITMAVAARQAIERGLSEEEAESEVADALRPLNDDLQALEKLHREAVAWQQDAKAAAERVRELDYLAEVARENMRVATREAQAELFEALGLRGEVEEWEGKRNGATCAVTTWFHEHERLVPTLTDENWQRVKDILKPRRAGARLDRRMILEALLDKARTGAKYEELQLECDYKTVRTTARRWLMRGSWAAAMELLKDEPGEPAWEQPPVRVRVSLRPLVTEFKLGDEEPSGTRASPTSTTPSSRCWRPTRRTPTTT